MSFYIDTEPTDAEAEAETPTEPPSFYLDTSKQSHQQQQQPQHHDEMPPPIGASSTGGKQRKRRRETTAEAWRQSADSGGEARIFYRSVSTGALGLDTSAGSDAGDANSSSASAAASTHEAPLKRRPPRFSRAALNSRFFDSIAAVASDGEGGGGVGGGASGVDAFRPGELSEQLRSALGLAPDQLPAHVYRMRELGYPPGWMLEARVASTGVAIFDDTRAISNGDDDDNGEAESDRAAAAAAAAAAAVKYDVTRLVKYPGFNCPLPAGVRDDHASLGFPAMRLEDHLSAFVHWLAGRNLIQASDAYHTRRVREARKAAATTAAAAASNYGGDGEGEEAAGTAEDDLDELEARRLELLRQLEGGDLEELDSCSSDLEADDEAAEEADVDNNDATAAADISAASSETPVVSTEFGSPVFANYRVKLPNPANFNRDIEQFRPFENLPNATGGYSKVNTVVKKIRHNLPKIA